MRYSVVHEGVPVGLVELRPGEVVAAWLAPLPALEPLRGTIRAGSNALLDLGFFGDAGSDGCDDVDALRAAAALQFDLIDERGNLDPATFVNLIQAPEGGIFVVARFSLAHGTVAAHLLHSTR